MLYFYILFVFFIRFSTCLEHFDTLGEGDANSNVTVYQQQAGTKYPCSCGTSYPPEVDRCSYQQNQGNRIKGGSNAKPGQFPWVVRMQLISSSIVTNQDGSTSPLDSTCTGAFITDQWVLLAAHCFCFVGAVPGPSAKKMKDLRMFIYYGSILKDKQTRQEFKLSDVFIPKRKDVPGDSMVYNLENCPSGLGGDIALVKLPNRVTLGPKVFKCFLDSPFPPTSDLQQSGLGVVCMPYEIDQRQSYYQNNNFDATVPGWGIVYNGNGADYKDDAPFAERLKFAELKLSHPNTPCNRPTDSICAFTRRRDACGGDSGSSLLFPVTTKFNKKDVCKSFSIGVVSNGPLCNQVTMNSGVYTFVPLYLNWIQRIVTGRESTKIPTTVMCSR